MNISPRIIAVVPAAGVGSRMQADRPKQYLTLHHQTIVEHTLEVLHTHPMVSRVVIALSPDDTCFSALPIAGASWLTCVHGGDSRAESVLAALNTLDESDWALVHDAARPCIAHADIDRLLAIRSDTSVAGGILACPVRDTMKRALPDTNKISHTESRERLWHALTPQLFTTRDLRNALTAGLSHGLDITDEASAMELAGFKVALIEGNPANIKVTHPQDLPLASFYLHSQTERN